MHLTPLSFTFSVYDVTATTQLVSQQALKGRGNAGDNQATITCTASQDAVLGEVLPPGQSLPPGRSLNDTVKLTFSVVAVKKP